MISKLSLKWELLVLYNKFQVIFMIVGNTKHNCRPLTLFKQNRDRALSSVSPTATNNTLGL